MHSLESQKFIPITTQITAPCYENVNNENLGNTVPSFPPASNCVPFIGALNENNLAYNDKLFKSVLGYYQLLSNVEQQKKLEKTDCFNPFIINNSIPKKIYPIMTPVTSMSIHSTSPVTTIPTIPLTATPTIIPTTTTFAKLNQSEILFNQNQPDPIFDHLLINPILQMPESIPQEIMLMSNRELEQLLTLIALTNPPIH